MEERDKQQVQPTNAGPIGASAVRLKVDPCSPIDRGVMSTFRCPSSPSACEHYDSLSLHSHFAMAQAAKKKLVICGGTGFLGIYIRIELLEITCRALR